MSALFFKVSLPQNIEKYRSLQKVAKRAGLTLKVKNVSRTRGVPVFLFYLSKAGSDGARPFSDLDEVREALAAMGGEG